MNYLTHRHRRLMSESEQALADAAEAPAGRRARIAAQVVSDREVYRQWECQHAGLVKPVAEHNHRSPQIVALRLLETAVLHKCALIDYIRQNEVTGAARARLFSSFYGPRETVDAILAEHRQYQLSLSSQVSADHLLSLMHDPASASMLKAYRAAWSAYFSLYCFAASAEDSDMADAIRTVLVDAKKRVIRMKRRLVSQKPHGNGFDFDREALLAKSGRYPVLNYLG